DRSSTVRARGPVQHGTARKVPTALHESHIGQQLVHTRPGAHPGTVAPQPRGIHVRKRNLRVELLGPVDTRTVHVWVARGDDTEPTQRTHHIDGVLVDVRGWTPQDVSLRGAHQ